MIKDFKIGDLVKIYGSGFGSLGMIKNTVTSPTTVKNTVTSPTTGEITYQVLFPSGEYEFIGVLWLSTYEE